MDRIGKEIAAREATGNAERKKKECCSLNPECPHTLESSIVCASLRRDWSENSPHNRTDTIASNSLCHQETSLAGSGLPSTIPHCMNDWSEVIDKLKVENYRRLNDQQSMKMISDRPSPSFYPGNRMDQVSEDISPYIRARENIIISSLKTSVGEGTQLRALSTYDFPVLKRMSNGKGIIRKSPETWIEEKLGCQTNVAYDNPLLKSHASNNLQFSYGVVKPGPESLLDRFNLREWLKPGCRKKDKIESFQIFVQILELVDHAHSHGVVLKDLRPSFFSLRPSNKIVYTGLSAKREKESALNQESIRKKPLENDLQYYCGLGVKQQKLGGDLKYVTQQSNFPSICSPGIEKCNDIDFSIKALKGSRGVEANSQKRFSCHNTSITTEQQSSSAFSTLEEKWYISPEELSGLDCTFSSNIYCLGVLLFELLCNFESSEVHAAVMMDLRHRILPPSFLSENPMEASFCMWLLHPEPSSRPTTSEILQSELTFISQMSHFKDDLSVCTDDDEAESELLLHFLASLEERKRKHASRLIENIRCLEKDIKEVERRNFQTSSSLFSDEYEGSTSVRKPSLHVAGPVTSATLSESISASKKNKARLMRDMRQLEEAYFSVRSRIPLTVSVAAGRSDKNLLRNRDTWTEVQKDKESSDVNQKSGDHLGPFFEGLCKFARYSKFKVCGTLINGDLLNSANVICSLSFDRDEEFIAAAGVSKKIKIFEFNSLLNDSIDIPYPVVEMSNKSKLSCVCWNNYIKNYLASTDYDGVVQMWDASTGQAFCQYVEHQKRAWSVDFSQADPTMFASASDDCSVKLWNINEKSSIATIQNPANVCSIQFSSFSTHFMAFGSADYKVYCYDLRNIRIPWCTLAGHEKTVSHVKFLDPETLVSASTDSTLKLWDLTKSSPVGLSTDACSLSCSGHTNEKNFVGLAVLDGYIACGSETNEIYSYHKSLPMPITSHKFGSVDPISGHEIADDSGQFVSSVCWRQKSNMVLAANSVGCMKILQLE